MGKTDIQSALDAGYSLSVARNTKFRLWSKPQVQEYFRELMQRAAPPERIVAKNSEHIEGKYEKTIVEQELGKDPVTGEQVVISERVKKETDVDAGVSLRAIELAIKAAEYMAQSTGGTMLEGLAEFIEAGRKRVHDARADS